MPRVKEVADFSDWSGWTATTKAWNYHKPFHRLNSPFFDLNAGPQASGKGLACGCRSEADAPFAEIAPAIMTAIPNWVPVHPENDQERELEGILLRSIHSFTDSPMTQWHDWYDWNFHIDPAPGFRALLGPANVNPELSGQATKMGFDKTVLRPWYDTKLNGVVECEWDIGVFANGGATMSGDKALIHAGSMFETDWAWPMTGQYAWIAGRWIYDCGHPIKRMNGKDVYLTHTELHPCKAVATARWEAVKFAENGDLFVPGIQFMFFASKWGGYLDFSTIHDKDYEFIVDLPIPAIPTGVDYNIGHMPDFALNTLVLRWDLLKKFNYRSFENAIHDPSNIGILNPIPEVDPSIELVEPFDPAKPQAKITIPLKSAPELRKFNSYGVIISLGWRDPDRSQARRVKKCTVSFSELTSGLTAMKERDRIPNELTDPGTWRVRFAVNGRWFAREFLVHPTSNFPLNVPDLVIHLSDEDGLHFSANGFIERTQGDFMVKHPAKGGVAVDDRTLRFMVDNPIDEPVIWDGVIDWQRHIVGDNSDKGKRVTFKVVEALKQRGQAVLIGFPPHTDENFPLGFLDPYLTTDENPLPVDKDMKATGKLLRAPYSLEADNGDLVEKTNLTDYFIQYTVSIEQQTV